VEPLAMPAGRADRRLGLDEQHPSATGPNTCEWTPVAVELITEDEDRLHGAILAAHEPRSGSRVQEPQLGPSIERWSHPRRQPNSTTLRL
jgi:hypothetical protein